MLRTRASRTVFQSMAGSSQTTGRASTPRAASAGSSDASKASS
ncbi:hypothetical protein QEG98_05100 [Myxococcus sp. MxC21-1]|nr:hypothetical protein QEG98_05100 [Myxococcus sp. MxC21-1]